MTGYKKFAYSHWYSRLVSLTFLTLLTACASLTLLTACAGVGKEANPVQTQQIYDASKSCVQLQAEIYTTNLKAGEKQAFYKNKKRDNIYLGLIIPLALNMDFSKTEWKEAQALGKRRDYLVSLFNQFGCQGYLGFAPASSTRS